MDTADFLGAARFNVDLSSTDPTGTVTVSIDGDVLSTRLAVPGESLSYPRVELPDGPHRVSAVVRSRNELVTAETVDLNVWSKPERAALVTPGEYAAGYAVASARVGDHTRTLSLYVNGKLVHTRQVRPGTVASMGGFEISRDVNTVELVASNPASSNRSVFTVKKLVYPWSTCIIVDKSEFRLYWIKDGVLVKTYPVAVGRVGATTPSAIWRIDAKYHSDPAGVYGPRKMRLFRRVGSGYTYTSYLIHGTNNSMSIGTRASAGCIRMYNSDVLELFPQVPLGTMVQTRD